MLPEASVQCDDNYCDLRVALSGACYSQRLSDDSQTASGRLISTVSGRPLCRSQRELGGVVDHVLRVSGTQYPRFGSQLDLVGDIREELEARIDILVGPIHTGDSPCHFGKGQFSGLYYYVSCDLTIVRRPV